MIAAAAYGAPCSDLVTPPHGVLRISPFIPGSAEFEDVPCASLDRIDVEAPRNTLERRYVLAQAVCRVRVGGQLNAIARKDRGGLRLRSDLESFGLAPQEEARRGHRICRCIITSQLNEGALQAAIAAGDVQYIPSLSLWSQPGLFSWDRLDRGSALLIETASGFAGRGADFGCGIGLLGRSVLRSQAVAHLVLVDVDARAVRAAQRNIADARAEFWQWDLRWPGRPDHLDAIDFVVTNPPFHDAGESQVSLGRAFIEAAGRWLTERGRLLLVANVTLPYERTLRAHFRETRELVRAGGYKVLEARH